MQIVVLVVGSLHHGECSLILFEFLKDLERLVYDLLLSLVTRQNFDHKGVISPGLVAGDVILSHGSIHLLLMHLKVMMKLRPEEFIILVLERRLHSFLVEVVRARVVAEQEIVVVLEATAMAAASIDVAKYQLAFIVVLHE